MKKYIFTTLLLLTLFSVSPKHSYAQQIVFDPKAVAQAIKDYGLQAKQLTEQTITAGAAPLTAAATTLTQIDKTITGPLRDATTLITIAKSGDMVRNLVLGSLDNQTRLLIQDPGKYLENEGKKAVALNIAQVQEAKGIYSQSILKQTIASTRQSSDVEGTLKSLSQSSIPGMVQNKLCLDDNLSEVAKNDVKLSDGTYDESDYRRRKKELYSTLCEGDPSTDPALAKTLTAVNAARPSLGGWDAMFETVNGDNDYVRAAKAQQVIIAEQAKRTEKEKQDLANGKGIASKTECVKWKIPEVGEKICEVKSIVNLAGQLSTSFSEAINAPLKVLTQAYGSGAVTGILGNVISIMGSVQGLQMALTVGGKSGSSSYSEGGAPTNTSTEVKSTPVNDLANDTTRRSQIVSSPQKQLNTHLSSLSGLASTDDQYLSQIAYYQSRLSGVKSCYDKLSTDFPSLLGDARVTGAIASYNNKKNSSDLLKGTLNEELAAITTAKTLISKTLADMSNSNSSEEILTLFNDYQNIVDGQNLPTQVTGLSRNAELQNFKTTSSGEFSTGEGGTGEMQQLQDQCTQIGQQMGSGGSGGGGGSVPPESTGS